MGSCIGLSQREPVPSVPAVLLRENIIMLVPAGFWVTSQKSYMCSTVAWKQPKTFVWVSRGSWVMLTHLPDFTLSKHHHWAGPGPQVSSPYGQYGVNHLIYSQHRAPGAPNRNSTCQPCTETVPRPLSDLSLVTSVLAISQDHIGPDEGE